MTLTALAVLCVLNNSKAGLAAIRSFAASARLSEPYHILSNTRTFAQPTPLEHVPQNIDHVEQFQRPTTERWRLVRARPHKKTKEVAHMSTGQEKQKELLSTDHGHFSMVK